MVFRSGGRRARHPPHGAPGLAEPIWIRAPLDLLGALGEEGTGGGGCRCGPVMNAGPTDLRSSPADGTAQQVTQIA
ncbi:unnamed protein product [Arctogadus glacialis]